MSLYAADDAKPNTLSPKEVEDGWILLFDGQTTFGWQTSGDVKVSDGALLLGGARAASASPTIALDHYDLRVEYRCKDTDVGELSFKGKFRTESRELKSAGNNPTRWEKVTMTVDFTGDDSLRSLVFSVSPTKSLALRNIMIKPLGLKPIFNGKDLTGWKEFKGEKYKSKFSVTPEGWINIKNGPGDLQTDEQWADFVLQIDCISNGDRLNSGVFFRCRPNEYQQGYEAQIHNGYTAEGKEYVLEEYDADTHKLKDKKKVRYTAIDYGTGAIYRRQPARFQVSKDREWFTMTVIAHGNHLAVWVNGIEVTDWTDNRPLNDNARGGCKLGKGPISLQGHDPTTDLSFRNIRIAELPTRQP
jgi:hypothetical protein